MGIGSPVVDLAAVRLVLESMSESGRHPQFGHSCAPGSSGCRQLGQVFTNLSRVRRQWSDAATGTCGARGRQAAVSGENAMKSRTRQPDPRIRATSALH
ncbi:MAG: hypothetical protein MNPFHGCM_01137 [Gemmatimonadaceae bacterium]|nr:hypothetical protein [Gemmatimonadaceae bacterium]